MNFYGTALTVRTGTFRMTAKRGAPAFTGSMHELLGEAPPQSHPRAPSHTMRASRQAARGGA